MTMRGMPPILDAAERAGLLDPLDVEVALRIARLARREEAGGDVPEVALLGAAMASRAIAHGHVCFEVGRAREIRPDPDGRGPVPWEWPDAGAWLEALAACPLVRRPPGDRASPLVLEGDLLYLDRWWGYEERLAADLRARAAAIAPGVDADLLAEGVGRLFQDAAGAGVDDQRSAARVAVERRLAVITGGPGTGKTTTVTKILLLLLEQERRRRPDVPADRLLAVSLLAPTGKAAARLEESVREVRARLAADATGIDPDLLAAVPAEALGIHRCLGANPDRPTRFRHDERHPLPADVAVVDEASMIDFGLMARLAEAVRPDARLVLLGDRNQLASVEAGAVFGDVCDAGAAGGAVRDCVVRLRRTYRFRADGGIGALARAP
ncbi:MAG: AAA family ATPase, partial [Deltaproteobacteria bacterium]|nr:AAA family ATPase [Deltaproteobacteria bacterium]